MKKIIGKIVAVLTILSINPLLLVKSVFAQRVEFPEELDKFAQENQLPTKNPTDMTVSVIQWALGFLGLAAVIMVIYGGLTWMTAAGNEEKIKKAKTILQYSILGLAIVLLSWVMVSFVIGRATEFSF